MTTLQKSAPWLLVLAMVLFTASRTYQTSFDKITVKEFEMVDAQGVRRASIKVEEGGEVVFRMMDQQGTIRVKLGSSSTGSGFVMFDGDTEPAVHVLAKKDKANIRLTVNGKARDL